MDRRLKVIHYLNQFFGQIGGEEKADTAPLKKDGTVGPGLLFQQVLGQEAE
ncbi:MAG: glycine/sarcosine/betaine reductase selenoprotein B family protein, partial [Desulfobacteraceae bacterium]